MSYNFYSIVSSIKDKSSQAMATLSSDLKEFSSIVQEDVAEVANTVRKTVHEQSEALRQRVEEQQEHDGGETTAGKDGSDGEPVDGSMTPKTEGDDDEQSPLAPEDEDAETAKTSEHRSSVSSLFSFAGLSLEAVGSKILQSADGLLDTLARAGAVEGEVDDADDSETDEDKIASARRYRLLALQEDAHTYIHPPMDVETFKKWRKALADEELEAIKQEVLAHYPTVADKMTELVPTSVMVDDFWAHYIYKASLLAAQEQRGADLLEHALNDSEEEVGWDAESPRHAGENDGRFPTFEDAHADDALPILELEQVDAPEPSSPAPVLGEQRAQLPEESDDDIPALNDSVSSDGESWIELDEQRRDAQQPPLSSSSSSSFVPVYGPRDGVYNVVGGDAKTTASAVISTPARVREDDEEDVDWGDEDDGDAAAAGASATATSTVAKSDATTEPSANGGAAAVATPDTKTRGPDWGEWD